MVFLGVALGAFGAHGLEEVLEKNSRVETWATAVLYHLVHGIALLVLGLFRIPPRGAWICFASGILIFSGSLYVLSHQYHQAWDDHPGRGSRFSGRLALSVRAGW